VFQKHQPERSEEEQEWLISSLPEQMADGDRDWVLKQIEIMPRQAMAALTKEYAEIYSSIIRDIEIPQVQRKNKARNTANTWLRAKISRYKKLLSRHKQVNSPSPF
jgi:hypothetical protein